MTGRFTYKGQELLKGKHELWREKFRFLVNFDKTAAVFTDILDNILSKILQKHTYHWVKSLMP